MLFLVPFFVTHFLEPVLSKLLDDFRSTLMHMLCVLEESVSCGACIAVLGNRLPPGQCDDRCIAHSRSGCGFATYREYII